MYLVEGSSLMNTTREQKLIVKLLNMPRTHRSLACKGTQRRQRPLAIASWVMLVASLRHEQQLQKQAGTLADALPK